MLALSKNHLGMAEPSHHLDGGSAGATTRNVTDSAAIFSADQRGSGYSPGVERGFAFLVALGINGVLLLGLLALGVVQNPVEREMPLTTFSVSPPSAAAEPPAPDAPQPVQQAEQPPEPPQAFQPVPPISLSLRRVASGPVALDIDAVQPMPAAMTGLAPAAPNPSLAAPGSVQAPMTPPDFSAAQLGNAGPKYPYLSRKAREEGVVMLRVLVNTDGRAAQLQVSRSSGHERLDKAALETVRKWRFAPAQRAGTSVEAWVLVPVTFALG